MSLKLTRTSVGGLIPIWQAVHENAQGGFKLTTGRLVAGDVIPAGTLVGATEANETARTVVLIKTIVVHASAGNTATDIQVKKTPKSNFKVGDYVAVVSGGKAYPITVIDTSQADYDTITVGTTLGVALSAGDILFESTSTGASAAVWSRPLGLTYEDYTFESDLDIAVVIRGTIYARRSPAVPSAIKTLIPNIIFSQSY